MKEAVNHPDHYQGAAVETRGILSLIGVPLDLLDGECIDAIEVMNAGFHEGNAIKYLWRCGQKGDAVEDLSKARWYLERWVDQWRTVGRIVFALRIAQYKAAIALIDDLRFKILHLENA